MNTVYVSGSFDDLRSPQVRFLEEAARLGPVHVVLWSDAVVGQMQGKAPKFVEAERKYLLESIRYVNRVTLCGSCGAGVSPGTAAGTAAPQGGRAFDRDRLPLDAPSPGMWMVGEAEASAAKEAYCQKRGLAYRVLRAEELRGFPELRDAAAGVTEGDSPFFAGAKIGTVPGRKKVIVTGCYDWFHSGHVRFFEEVSALGELYVCVGHDANIRFLKGEGHPLFPAEERRYMVQSIRFVRQGLISSGDGWLDAEPEIARLHPDIYAVNEDGDRPEKRQYCQAHGIEYRVLQRVPKEGLPRRQSTDLRGF
jgi:cytidyltransferase-like protein